MYSTVIIHTYCTKLQERKLWNLVAKILSYSTTKEINSQVIHKQVHCTRTETSRTVFPSPCVTFINDDKAKQDRTRDRW